MAKNKGKNKAQKQSAPAPAAEVSAPSVDNTPDSKGFGEATSINAEEVADERDAMYARHAEDNYSENKPENSETSPEEEVVGDEPKETSTEEAPVAPVEDKPKVDDFQPEAPAEEAGKDEVPSDEDKDDDDKEIKTVPLAALHEEREKRKAKDKEVDTLKGQLQEVLQTVKELSDNANKPKMDIAELEKNYYDDPEAALKQLMTKIQGLEGQVADQSQRETTRAQQAGQEIQTRNIEDSDSDLEKAGFPGFKEFGVSAVKEHLVQMNYTDPETAASLDNREGWEHIYKETVFPTVKKLFAIKQREESTAGKTKLKEVATLAGSPGSSNKPKGEKAKDWDYDDYKKMREENSAPGGY